MVCCIRLANMLVPCNGMCKLLYARGYLDDGLEICAMIALYVLIRLGIKLCTALNCMGTRGLEIYQWLHCAL